ncbi:MAG TPA: hypothetical protein VFJ19_07940 [Nocardioidaceae bacterium]|nr:hypothetical protein [Nocardioidaceae bacterium]
MWFWIGLVLAFLLVGATWAWAARGVESRAHEPGTTFFDDAPK